MTDNEIDIIKAAQHDYLIEHYFKKTRIEPSDIELHLDDTLRPGDLIQTGIYLAEVLYTYEDGSEGPDAKCQWLGSTETEDISWFFQFGPAYKLTPKTEEYTL